MFKFSEHYIIKEKHPFEIAHSAMLTEQAARILAGCFWLGVISLPETVSNNIAKKTIFDDTPEQAFEFFGSDQNRGLTEEQVAERLERWGHNEVAEPKKNRWLQFAGKFWSLSAWLLELVILISWYLQKYSDVIVVTGLLVINGVLSFFEELQAERSLDELKAKLSVNSRVLRSGVWKVITARELVPGDVLRVRSGDFVPADVKIFSGKITVDQASLTGESGAISKTDDDNLYSGSIVKSGEANGIVLSTGARTFFGKTTQLMQLARPKLHIEEIISSVVQRLLVVISILVVVTLGYVVYKRMPVLEILPLMLVVLLSAIPVALPVMMTVTTALGARELSQRGVLVTRLNASEDAAMLDVICVDKTGTLTFNKLGLAETFSLNPYDDTELIKYSVIASQEADQDPIDLALIEAAKARSINLSGVTIARFSPFSPETRRTEALFQEGSRSCKAMKGAVGTIIKLCNAGEAELQQVQAKVAELSAAGNKVLAVALAEEGQTCSLVGLVGLRDKPRPDSKLLIEEARQLGISVKMLTGDALSTARKIAEQVGINGDIRAVGEVADLLRTDPRGAAKIIENIGGLAEVYPEDKFLIVRALQQAGHIVGMTGDGVNDAPALKQSEVGIAVNNATDVAKEAAGMVLTTEGLSGIIDMVKIGRSVHRRIQIWVLNKISRTILKAAFVIGAFLLTGQFFVSAFAMLILIFMTDFVKIALATDNVRWSQKPSKLDIVQITKVAVVLGTIMVFEAGALIYLGISQLGISPAGEAIKTYSFVILFFFAIFSLLSVREEGHFWQSRPSEILSAALAADAVAALVLSLVGVPGLVSLDWKSVAAIISYAFIFSLVINDFVKVILLRNMAK